MSRYSLLADQESSFLRTLEEAGIAPGYGAENLRLEGVGVKADSSRAATLSFCPALIAGKGEVRPVEQGRIILSESPSVHFSNSSVERIFTRVRTMKYGFLSCKCRIFNRGNVVVVEAVEDLQVTYLPEERRDLRLRRGGYLSFLQEQVS
ncbi:MAG: hypothetical protein WD200_04650 [Candidatus Andersenbacteria bacterium]